MYLNIPKIVYISDWFILCVFYTLLLKTNELIYVYVFFKGTLEVSSVTGRLEPTYPAWKRNMFRYFVSLPIIALCISLVFVIMIVSFIIQVHITCTYIHAYIGRVNNH